MEEWAAIHKEERRKPFCYWMSNTVPTYFGVKLMQLADIKHGFNYRFIKRHKYHLIDTKLGYGYHEIENRMLYGMFSLLVGYVEIEKAQCHWLSLENDAVRPSPRMAGLAHLDWEIGLTHDKDEMDAIDKPYLAGKPTPQAVAAFKIKELYLWWEDERPNRTDPWDEYELDSERNKDESIFEMMANRTEKEKKEFNAIMRKREKLEKKYDNEDEKKLIELIKIRQSLWT